MNGTFAEVNHSVAEIASGWRSDRAQRQLRRHLDPADFALLCSSWHTPTTGRIPEGQWVNRDRASHELTIDGEYCKRILLVGSDTPTKAGICARPPMGHFLPMKMKEEHGQTPGSGVAA